jgi:glycosyltransferase involved in cell wall biosynthesis
MAFHYMAHFLPMDGYGYAAIKIAEALQAEGAPVEQIDMCDGDRRRIPMMARTWELEHPALMMTVAGWWRDVRTPRLVGYTMHEATVVPAEYVNPINETADLCLVPCQWCADTFRESGVTTPIQVVKWGIDTRDYYPLPRHYGRDQYTFLWSGTPDMRKGWDVAYRAFLKAFGNRRKDVRLVLHFRERPPGVKGFADENVQMMEGLYDRPMLRAMLQMADCFVFPSRGEGWGLPPREAAATGLPVITTNYSGLAEEIDAWALPLRVKGMSVADYGWFEKGEIGQWAEPDVDHLVELMRWCFENRTEAAAIGGAAARWLARNTPWARTARQLMEIMQ